MLKLLVWIIFLNVIGINKAGYIPPTVRYLCPKNKILIHPCLCVSESDEGILVECENTNLAQVSVALNNLAIENIPSNINLIRCNIGRLFGSLFFNVQSRILQIKDSPIVEINDYVFAGVNKTLNELHLINLPLKTFPKGALEILGNLSKLIITGHRLIELPSNAFSSPIKTKLVHLEISNGPLFKIPVDMFHPLIKIKKIDFHGNYLDELQKGQFKGLRDAEIIDFSYNNFTKIRPDVMGDLIKLGWCNFSHNNIKELTRGTFARNSVLKLLNLSNNKIGKLDANSFKGLRFLRRLFLSDNKINNVGRETFAAVSKIGTIDLARNLISKIDFQMFNDLRFIEVIDVSENRVEVIKKNAFKNIYLATINLSKNNISKVEDGAFQNCINITTLDFSQNKLKNFLSKSFDENSYATEFQLSFNELTSMNQVPIKFMNGIKILNVSHNLIANIPKGTYPKLYELHTIDYSYNNITEIFNGVMHTLFSLRKIDFSYNFMEAIKPATFGPIPTLLELNLNYNKLKDVAKGSLTSLISLRNLQLKGNYLKKIFQLPISLSHLDLSNNSLSAIGEKVWPPMNSLLYLDLSYNLIEDNGLEGGSFQNLLTVKEVNFNYNKIKNVPWAALSPLTSLQYLYLKGNQLSNLPASSFGSLPVLMNLDMSMNNLTNVSESAFQGLLQLQSLNFSYNFISFIPNAGFKSLVSLKTLDLSNNKLEKLDNGTHGFLDECLSLNFLNISNNKIKTLGRKSFPNDPYIPYNIQDVDISYNFIPALSSEMLNGAKRFKKFNVSHNLISTVRKGVFENLNQIEILDLSFNNMEYNSFDEDDKFNFSSSLKEINLSHNLFNAFRWFAFKNVTGKFLLNISFNNFSTIDDQVQKMIKDENTVLFEGNPLNCDCRVKPIRNHLKRQTVIEEHYKNIVCKMPHFLMEKSLVDVSEEFLTCTKNNEFKNENYVTPDLELKIIEKGKAIKWRFLKNDDVANINVILQLKNGTIFEEDVPYWERKYFFRDKLKNLKPNSEICLLAKTSENFLKNYHSEQCKAISEIVSNKSVIVRNVQYKLFYFFMSIVHIIYYYKVIK